MTNHFQLKDLGVTIFTFGIRNGNVKELRDMASLPTDEHSFILDSFQEFEALARRALHEGTKTLTVFIKCNLFRYSIKQANFLGPLRLVSDSRSPPV